VKHQIKARDVIAYLAALQDRARNEDRRSDAQHYADAVWLIRRDGKSKKRGGRPDEGVPQGGAGAGVQGGSRDSESRAVNTPGNRQKGRR
jgi:hypothetical protein